jgi:hypothetical protein
MLSIEYICFDFMVNKWMFVEGILHMKKVYFSGAKYYEVILLEMEWVLRILFGENIRRGDS